ncbi:hypothetical protein [Caldovatus sediminis]|nr:hypothetical protein [Caldovatus sediminis]
MQDYRPLAANITVTKAELAARLGVTRGRVSQWLAAGLPVGPDGRVPLLAALDWVLATLDGGRAAATRRAAAAWRDETIFLATATEAVSAVLAEVPVAVALAAAEVGIGRAEAERLGNMTLLFMGTEAAEQLRAAGAPEPLLPHPEAWRAGVNWASLFGADGRSRVAGALRAATALAERGEG